VQWRGAASGRGGDNTKRARAPRWDLHLVPHPRAAVAREACAGALHARRPGACTASMTGPSRAADPSYQQGGTADRRFLALWLEAGFPRLPITYREMLLPVVSAGNGPAGGPPRRATTGGWTSRAVGRVLSRAAVAGDAVTVIHLGWPLPTTSSALPACSGGPPSIARCLGLLRMGFTEPTWSPRPLVVSYTTVSPLLPRRRTGEGAVCSLWHCPAGRPGWLLATILPFGARTFLGGGCPPTRPSARLVHLHCSGGGGTLPAASADLVAGAAGCALTADAGRLTPR
jgi:hypothetical protein